MVARTHDPSIARGVVAEWSQAVGEVDQPMLELVGELRRHRRVGLLTNATTRLEADLQTHGIAEQFDAICNSARLGIAKPDQRTFRLAAESLGVQPEACVFVDDTPANVEAAMAIGMAGIHYTGIEALREELRALGIK